TVGQVQMMYSSKCFMESRERDPKAGMGCISCHDPHSVPPPEKVEDHYRQACQKCHEQLPCKEPEEKRAKANDNSCHKCHMPRLKDEVGAHSALTDHRIVRTLAKGPRLFVPKKSGGFFNVSFHADLLERKSRDPVERRAQALVALG